MIANTGEIGNYFVFVYAAKNMIAQFQCPTLGDCSMEVNRIAKERRARNLVTSRATATRMKGKSGRVRLWDDPIEVSILNTV